MANERWYTLYTKPKSEFQVANGLQRRGIQTYLPEIELPQKGRRQQPQPFFPCYLFVKIDLSAVGLSVVQWTPGLRRLVAFGNQPVPLPDEVIDLIQRRLGEIEASGGWPVHPFQPGDTVRFTEGPFRDMLAIFEGPTGPSERVQVLLSILGRLSRVQVSPANLAKAPDQAEVSLPKRPRRTRGRGRHIRSQTALHT
jgi:transcriptional antiterminator RfaH